MEKGFYRDQELEQESDFERYRRKSLTGSSGRRERRTITIGKKTYKNNLMKTAVASALTVSLVIGGGFAAYKGIEGTMKINEIAYQFSVEVINPETHRTDNNQYYFFDYDDIADRIFSMENPDIGFYLFYKNEGAYQTDKLMRETRYGSFENYLREHNYEDEKEFSRTMEQITLLTHEMNENQDSIDILTKEHMNNGKNEGSYGGK